MCVGIYERLSTFKSIVRLGLAMMHFEIAKYATSPKIGVMKDELLSEVPTNIF